ncbi:CDP-alcohol phosphatidyltransferase family protein [Natronoarchaeum sp. GCM10025703]|uniref:CDP-alcohol phosphatidyltransferase family protein n=1 Tax=Natronoarchaeum sp. GCM10025703 TaxID=3252685 RepID=UPI00360CB9A8
MWLPGLLFAVAAAVDALDGAIARRLDCESKRGERLDVEIDALTVLVGSVLAVRYDVVPVVFAVVGIARYAFVGGFTIDNSADARYTTSIRAISDAGLAVLQC